MGYRDSINKVLKSDFSKASAKERDEAAADVIMVCSFACAGLQVQPIPGLEQAILPVQIGMVLAIAHIFGEELSRKRATEILMDLAAITGVSIVGRQVLLSAAKFLLPGLGGILSGPYVFSVTWGTGHAAIHYLRSGGRADKDAIKKIFEQEKERSKAHYSDDAARANRPDERDVSDTK